MNKELKDKILYISGWVALGIVTLWLILKAVGIIQTPVWIQMIPYAGAIFWAGVTYQQFNSIKEDVKSLKVQINHVEKRLTIVETKL